MDRWLKMFNEAVSVGSHLADVNQLVRPRHQLSSLLANAEI